MIKLYLIIFWILLFMIPLGNYAQVDEFGLANKCYNLKYKQKKRFRDLKIRGSSSIYYFKPTALGKYMLYNNSKKKTLTKRRFFTSNFEKSGNNNVWKIIPKSKGNGFYIKNKANNRYLKQRYFFRRPLSNKFTYTRRKNKATEFRTYQVKSCNEFPEAELNYTGKIHKGSNKDGTVWGMADIHSHPASEFMGGGYMNHGSMFSPYGLPSALKSCESKHGRYGGFDLVGAGAVDQPSKNLIHNTEGYPDFTDWPAPKKVTHQKAYYQWLNRARLGGLRILTIASTENTFLAESLNSLAKVRNKLTNSVLKKASNNVSFSGSNTHNKTMKFLRDLEEYIDAQEGGPGKGWFKIVKSPDQARDEIKKGNLAVVLGVEIPDLFDCIDGAESSVNCSRKYISDKLDFYQDQGVSVVWPIHHWDNDFGGARSQGLVTELPNVLFNGNEFQWESLESFEKSQDDAYIPGHKSKPIFYKGMNISDIFNDLPGYYPGIVSGTLVTRAIQGLTNNTEYELPKLPHSPSEKYVNAKRLSNTGRILIEELMKRGMMIDLDHCSVNTLNDINEILNTYEYPSLFTHNQNFEGLKHIYENGGIISPTLSKSNSDEVLRIINRGLKVIKDNNYDVVGIPFTTDLFGTLKTPSADGDDVIDYPFKSYDKKITFQEQQTGNKTFDFTKDGFAHMGLLPDFIRVLQEKDSSKDALTALFNGAEQYLRHWEKVRKASRKFNHSYKIQNKTIENVVAKRTNNRKLIKQILEDILMSETVGMSVVKDSFTEDNSIIVFPTLVENTFTILSPESSEMRLLLNDLNGKLLVNMVVDSHNTSNLNILANKLPGVYLLNIIDTATLEQATFKLVKK